MRTIGVKQVDLANAYRRVRQHTLDLCKPLYIEDYGVQPMVDASPPKWHLAHATWFFEAFVLEPFDSQYQRFNPSYEYLFNSYYETVGNRHPRNQRGNLSRPLVEEVFAYRDYVNASIENLLQKQPASTEIANRMVLGLNHEQQHQELLLTDLKCNFGSNPLRPKYSDELPAVQTVDSKTLEYHEFSSGKYQIGAPTHKDRFCFDNETPEHTVWINPFAVANRLVTNSEYLEFVLDGGYDDPNLWLSDGWAELNSRKWRCPEYWTDYDGTWMEYSLSGEQALIANQPVTHISFYEADAYARWAHARLPSEYEWEFVAKTHAAADVPNLAGQRYFQPTPAVAKSNGIEQLIGDCWEWTQSSYAPYPGFVPLEGTLGEYNGKFMANQMVLRGGSCATPNDHIRTTYRNFFYPKDRWQFTGIRLARSIDT